MRQNERFMDLKTEISTVPCNGCTLCCKGDAIFLHPDKGDDISIYETVVTKHPLSGKKAHMLKHKPNGDCIYLGEKGCDNYENRPIICREFDCRKLFLSLTKNQRRNMVDNGTCDKEHLEAGKKRVNTLPQAERKICRDRRG